MRPNIGGISVTWESSVWTDIRSTTELLCCDQLSTSSQYMRTFHTVALRGTMLITSATSLGRQYTRRSIYTRVLNFGHFLTAKKEGRLIRRSTCTCVHTVIQHASSVLQWCIQQQVIAKTAQQCSTFAQQYHNNETKYYIASLTTPLFMVALCNRADHYIFALWFLSSIYLFLRRLISAAADWMFTILPHMVWP